LNRGAASEGSAFGRNPRVELGEVTEVLYTDSWKEERRRQYTVVGK
jgi:hypothetical protein